MKTSAENLEDDRVDQWYNQVRTENSLTEYDSCLLKEHLLDTIDELKEKGLNGAESFEVAIIRLGKNFNYEEEYARVNSDTLLIRNILLAFSGVMIYFLLYYSMTVCCGLMFYNLHEVIGDPLQLYGYTLNFLFYYHLIIVVFTIVIYKWNITFLKKIENLKINPLYIFLLIAIVFGLAFTNFQVQYLVKSELTIKYLVVARYYWTLSKAGYSFSLIMSICFLILLIKNKWYNKEAIKRRNNSKSL